MTKTAKQAIMDYFGITLVPESLLKELEAIHQQEVAKAREKAIEDVKYAGYGYDDGTGFVIKISFKELENLKASDR